MNRDATPFPRRPIPVFGESIYGFDRRFAACARFTSLDGFRQTTGLLDIGPRSVEGKFHRLAALAGEQPTVLDHMRWIPKKSASGAAVVDLCGHDIREAYLRSDTLRFCPQCLDEDGPAEQRIHRQAWQILQVCACPRHRTLLIEECDECGGSFRQIRKTKVWACACGREMAAMSAAAAPDGAVVMSLEFMRLLGPSSGSLPDQPAGLTEPFRAMGLDDLLTVAATLGMGATTPSSDDEPTTRTSKVYNRRAAIDYHIGVRDAASAMDAAHRIITGWPASADALFAGIADRNPCPPTDHAVLSIFATRVGYQLLAPIRSIDGSDIDVIQVALAEWLYRERGIYLDGRRRAKVGVDGDVHIDVADAIRRLEGRAVNPGAIKAWADAGMVDLVGKKVRLSTVEATVARLESLEVADFDDPIGAEAWSGVLLYGEHFRRSDALRAVLSGEIRVRRVEGCDGRGLASLLVCRTDLTAMAGAARPKPKRRTPANPEDARRIQLDRRLADIRQRDGFTYPARIRELFAKLWPGAEPIEVEAPDIRCNYVVGRYGGRRCPRRVYSMMDALAVMTACHGPPLAG